MGKIDTSGWKEFRIGDYFKVEYGRFHAKDELGTGTVNYITTSGFNNGITNTCEEATHQGNCITVASDGAMGASFYQEEAFTTSNIVSTLTPLPHTPLNKYNALFLCAIIFGKRTEFGWLGFKMSVDRVRNLRVKLPSTPNGAPDWTYMESYMASLETKVAESLTLLQAAKDAEKKKVDTREWGEFHLYDIFSISMGNKFDRSKMCEVDEGINFVGRSALTNGVACTVTSVEDKKGNTVQPYPAGDITIALGGSIGAAFVQDREFYTSQNVCVLHTDDHSITERAKWFVSASITASCGNYEAFTDELNRHIRTDFIIRLPVDKTGQPDWAYMEEYMRKVEEQVKKTINTFCVIRNIKFDC